MWAGGNMWLVYNTYVSLFQGLCSFLLVAEFPIYMMGSKLVRAFSFTVAYLYNVTWFFAGAEFLHYNVTAHMQNNDYYDNPLSMFNVVELLIDMFFAFNLTMNLPIVIINAVILWKEFRFEYTE